MNTQWESSIAKAVDGVVRVSKYEIGPTIGEGTFGKFPFIQPYHSFTLLAE